MKMGFVSAILETSSYEEVMDTAKELGYKAVELACWPKEKATRRYAGVSHLDVDNLTQERIDEVLSYAKKCGIEISALAYYPNPMDGNDEVREKTLEHLKKVIKASHRLGINMVTTFIGRDQNKSVDENLEKIQEVWEPILAFAKEQQVKIAIENCPMLFGQEQWPGGQNLFTTPKLWREIFDLLPSEYLGINYDPSHFVWQGIDYIKPIYEFKEKIFHIHFKDIKIHEDLLNDVGIMAYPLEYMSPKLPGLGDVDWGKYVSALTDIGYKGCGCVEVEDRAFEESFEDVLKSLRLSKRYLEQFVI